MLRKIGEDVTESLEHVPSRWKVIQHVRENFSCRACETIAQTPAPSHPIGDDHVEPLGPAHWAACRVRGRGGVRSARWKNPRPSAQRK
jgi:hypothetical protein